MILLVFVLVYGFVLLLFVFFALACDFACFILACSLLV